ncbi:hypothetical protein MYX84_14120 [Acidobacteria bacterium AH-259-O06]|nr:hypothetical protein [Acidobacteria bacterium AH-259-O06]
MKLGICVRAMKFRATRRFLIVFGFILILVSTLNSTALAFSPPGAKVPFHNEKYCNYKRALLERHLFDGLVVNVCLDRPHGDVIKSHFGDSTLWTGVLLGTLALDYHQTKDSRTLEQISEIVDALSRLQVAPGYLVRTDRGEEAGTKLAEPSAGQYMGVLFGYDLAFKYADDNAIRRKIREDAENMGRYLQNNWYIFFKPTGGGLVDRGPNGVFFEYVWSKILQRITGDTRESRPISWRQFRQKLKGGRISLDAWISLMGKLFSPRKRYTMFLRNVVGLYHWDIVKYFNIHLAFLSVYAALSGDEEDDPEVLAAFKKLYEDVRNIPGDENALFAAIARSLTGADDNQTRSAISRLKDLPESLPNSWHDTPYHQDNAWQRSPKNRRKVYLVFNQGSPCKYIEYPGLDYMLPYMLCTLEDGLLP